MSAPADNSPSPVASAETATAADLPVPSPDAENSEAGFVPKKSFYLRNRTLVWTVFALVAAANVVMVCLFPIPGNDMASRYAPMTEAFAAGDWRVAFHPRFGMLFSAVTGTVCRLTGLNGFRSCQAVSLVFFLLAVFPLWRIFKRIWGERVAATGCFLYLMCSFLTRYAYYGLRETWKTFGIALGVWGVMAVLHAPRRRRGYLIAAAAGAFLIAVRGDGAFYALVLLLAAAKIEMGMFRRLPVRTFLCGLLLLVLISPQLYYNYEKLGYPVPESRHAQLLKRMGMPPMKTPEAELP
ncbi:MAG: glycosyltransferase family 39 protein [Lentisphaeria bacterium]|nr:glycosyltransferase family 39 protein [Lentisphaeria bacterium]